MHPTDTFRIFQNVTHDKVKAVKIHANNLKGEEDLAVGRSGVVHLVDGDDELLDSESVGQEGVLSSLAFLGDAGLEFAGAAGHDQHRAIGLGRSRDHVLDKIPGCCSRNGRVSNP